MDRENDLFEEITTNAQLTEVSGGGGTFCLTTNDCDADSCDTKQDDVDSFSPF